MVELKPSGAARGLGERAWAQHCAVCHGKDGKGDPQRQFPSIEGAHKRIARAGFLELLEKGRGVMPPFGFLTGAEREALAARAYGEPEPKPGSESGNEPEHWKGEAKKAGRPYAHLGYKPLPRPRGLPGAEAALGHAERDRLRPGEIRWSVPLGEVPELTKRGLPPTGTENYGGPIVTKGGLVFIAATKDERSGLSSRAY